MITVVFEDDNLIYFYDTHPEHMYYMKRKSDGFTSQPFFDIQSMENAYIEGRIDWHE